MSHDLASLFETTTPPSPLCLPHLLHSSFPHPLHSSLPPLSRWRTWVARETVVRHERDHRPHAERPRDLVLAASDEQDLVSWLHEGVLAWDPVSTKQWRRSWI
ncbi:hypothetical protein BDA96_03G157500 [Sorghum bicolor]|uniref:Uncharacterized protein n=1 Tax=Sorghum bicolor TaxID=4558 RepID=A0A921RC65_SORBI|nr:hypothetical protein BDA96_03G157500 [Sorghum bicolor]